MKKLVVFLTIVVAFFTIAAMTPLHSVSSPIVQQEKDIPAYAKWGVMAMQKTRKNTQTSNNRLFAYGACCWTKYIVEKFKLILKEKGREFGLFVDLEFKNDTEELVNITFTETTP
ncbi:hypothetical protein UACE39S_01167 [Ureibacillus acetophenoni]